MLAVVFLFKMKAFDDDEGHGTHVGGIVVGAALRHNSS